MGRTLSGELDPSGKAASPGTGNVPLSVGASRARISTDTCREGERGSHARVGGTRGDRGLAGGVGVPRGPLDRCLGHPGQAAMVICSSLEKVVMVRARGRLRNSSLHLEGQKDSKSVLFVSPVGQLHSQGMH